MKNKKQYVPPIFEVITLEELEEINATYSSISGTSNPAINVGTMTTDPDAGNHPFNATKGLEGGDVNSWFN